MLQIFSSRSLYTKRARLLAILWTLLIFILCFLPGQDLPDIRIPFIDKWAHLVLFGLFTMLWLLANPRRHIKLLAGLQLIAIYIGWLVEYIQGSFIPGRSQDNMDTLADSIGGFIGIALFVMLSLIAEVYNKKTLSQ